jgi:hypothetical protein
LIIHFNQGVFLKGLHLPISLPLVGWMLKIEWCVSWMLIPMFKNLTGFPLIPFGKESHGNITAFFENMDIMAAVIYGSN